MKDLRSVVVAAAVVMVLVPVLVNAIVLVNCNFGCLSCCRECGCSFFFGSCWDVFMLEPEFSCDLFYQTDQFTFKHKKHLFRSDMP